MQEETIEEELEFIEKFVEVIDEELGEVKAYLKEEGDKIDKEKREDIKDKLDNILSNVGSIHNVHCWIRCMNNGGECPFKEDEDSHPKEREYRTYKITEKDGTSEIWRSEKGTKRVYITDEEHKERLAAKVKEYEKDGRKIEEVED